MYMVSLMCNLLPSEPSKLYLKYYLLSVFVFKPLTRLSYFGIDSKTSYFNLFTKSKICKNLKFSKYEVLLQKCLSVCEYLKTVRVVQKTFNIITLNTTSFLQYVKEVIIENQTNKKIGSLENLIRESIANRSTKRL